MRTGDVTARARGDGTVLYRSGDELRTDPVAVRARGDDAVLYASGEVGAHECSGKSISCGSGKRECSLKIAACPDRHSCSGTKNGFDKDLSGAMSSVLTWEEIGAAGGGCVPVERGSASVAFCGVTYGKKAQ